MSAFLLFFEQMPVWQKLGWVIFCIAVFWLLEGYYRDVNNPYDKTRHAKTNFGLLSLVMVINVVFGVLTAGVFIWLNQSELGQTRWH